jgi:plastocyanin
MNHVRAAALLLMLGGAFLAAACGGGDDSAEPESTKPPATAASSPVATADDGDDGDGASAITLVAKDTLWDQTKIEAKAGAITFTVDNQDGGIVHNLHIYKGTDNTGEDLGQTELEAGPVTQTLTVTLEPGTYFFVCDVHPATMAGTIEVSAE